MSSLDWTGLDWKLLSCVLTQYQCFIFFLSYHGYLKYCDTTDGNLIYFVFIYCIQKAVLLVCVIVTLSLREMQLFFCLPSYLHLFSFFLQSYLFAFDKSIKSKLLGIS